jgi:hypothetical protein
MKKLNELFFNNITLYIFIKISGTLFALYVFAKFTPLADAQNYLDLNLNLNGTPFRTKLVHTITSLFNQTLGPLFTHLTFSFFSGIGILILSFTLKNKFILLLLLAPSALIWSSIVGKEAIYYGVNTLLLAIWVLHIQDKQKKINIFTFLGVFLLFVICIIFRPHYSMPIMYLFASSYVLITYKLKNLRPFLLTLMLLLAFLSIVYFYFIAEIPYNLVIHGYESISPSGFTSRHSFFNIDPTQPFLEFNKNLIFKYSFFSIIGPFPSELDRIEFIPFFLEGLAILLTPIFTLLYFQNKNKSDKFSLLFKLSILPAILMAFLIHAPFGILNPGSAIRWRVNFELLFYAYPLILILLSRRKK